MKRRWRPIRRRIVALYEAHGEDVRVTTQRQTNGLWRVVVQVFNPHHSYRPWWQNADVTRRRRVDAAREALRLIQQRWEVIRG